MIRMYDLFRVTTEVDKLESVLTEIGEDTIRSIPLMELLFRDVRGLNRGKVAPITDEDTARVTSGRLTSLYHFSVAGI